MKSVKVYYKDGIKKNRDDLLMSHFETVSSISSVYNNQFLQIRQGDGETLISLSEILSVEIIEEI